MFAVEDSEAKIVAVLHDVVEDSKPPHRWGMEGLPFRGEYNKNITNRKPFYALPGK